MEDGRAHRYVSGKSEVGGELSVLGFGILLEAFVKIPYIVLHKGCVVEPSR